MEQEKRSGRWPKRCACGKTFHRAEWLALHFAGRWCVGDLSLDLRTCPCGSTISMPTSALSEDV